MQRFLLVVIVLLLILSTTAAVPPPYPCYYTNPGGAALVEVKIKPDGTMVCKYAFVPVEPPPAAELSTWRR